MFSCEVQVVPSMQFVCQEHAALLVDGQLKTTCGFLSRNDVCVDVNLFSKYRKLGEDKMESKLIPALGEETTAILLAHPNEIEMNVRTHTLPMERGLVRMALTFNLSGQSQQIASLRRCAQLQVWMKPHITMPAGSTLWGALGYEEGNEKLKQLMMERKKRKDEKEELVSAPDVRILFLIVASLHICA